MRGFNQAALILAVALNGFQTGLVLGVNPWVGRPDSIEQRIDRTAADLSSIERELESELKYLHQRASLTGGQPLAAQFQEDLDRLVAMRAAERPAARTTVSLMERRARSSLFVLLSIVEVGLVGGVVANLWERPWRRVSDPSNEA